MTPALKPEPPVSGVPLSMQVARAACCVVGFGVVLSISPGCSSSEPESASDELPQTPGRLASNPRPDTPRYWQARVLDLTGEGRADTVRLEAVGLRTDSLRVTLSFVVDGQKRFREVWNSGYELALLDSAALEPSRADSILRTRLDGVLANVALGRLGAPGLRLMAEDSAALAGIQPRPTHGVSFAYGYETTVRLAWDAPRGRFVRLWDCC